MSDKSTTVRRALPTALVFAFALTSCASDDSNSDDASTITVSAAASLTDVFSDIGAAFTEQYPDIQIRFNFAGSSTLAEQITAGAPVDVFASASSVSMDKAIDVLDDPIDFASNSLAIAVPPTNPANITNLADLADRSVTLVICNSPVPCGAATQQLFERAGLDVTPASLEPDVRAVLTKVITDEADAGIVYRTDIAAAGDQIASVEIPSGDNVVTVYPIAVTKNARPRAQIFVDFVLGDSGQEILRGWGFGSP